MKKENETAANIADKATTETVKDTKPAAEKAPARFAYRAIHDGSAYRWAKMDMESGKTLEELRGPIVLQDAEVTNRDLTHLYKNCILQVHGAPVEGHDANTEGLDRVEFRDWGYPRLYRNSDGKKLTKSPLVVLDEAGTCFAQF